MLLQSHGSFDLLAEFDAANEAFTTFSKKSEPERVSSRKVAGVFEYVGGRRLLLYRLSGVLYVQVDDERMRMNDLSIELMRANNGRVLRLSADGGFMLELGYRLIDLDPALSDDSTAFVEEEDFDFGLFLANLASDQRRQDRMFTES